MERGSLQLSFGVFGKSFIAEVLRSREIGSSVTYFPYTVSYFRTPTFFWTLELQQRVQILRDYIFLPVEQVYVCLKL